MDTTRWITHCYGRFLIDLPPQAIIIGAGYDLWGDPIEQLDEPAESLAALINQRESGLKEQQHDKIQSSMFLRRLEHGEHSKSLLSWSSGASLEMYMLDTYVVAKPAWRVYRWKGGVSPDREQHAIEMANDLARNIRSREPGEIPTEPGFCLDGGYIAGSQFQSEGFRLGVSFPEHPGAYFAFRSSTGAEKDRLLERIDGFLMGAAKLVAGIETLRKGRHHVGPIEAEEYLVAGSDKSQRVYSLAWESQGKDGSIGEPNITVSLGVLGRNNKADGSPPDPAFESDQQALDLWDAIIDSIRLRPGAVGP